MTVGRLWLIVLTLCSVLALAPVRPAAAQQAPAQQAGIIEGQVTNGTAGAGPAADLEVVVHMLQSRQKIGEQRVRTDGVGRFRVEGLATGPDMLYFPILEYQGVAYYPDRPVLFDGGAAAARTEITVYETTPVGEALSFERLNMLVMAVSPTSMTIMEMGAVVNASDRTYAADPAVTGSARTLRFSLPRQAIQISPQAGLPSDSLETTPDGFASTDAVRPGRREVAFSYQLPYDASAVDFSRSFAFPVGTFTVFVPDEVGGVAAPNMALLGTTELGGRRFRQYVAEGVVVGSELRFRLTGLPAPWFARPRDLGLLVAGLGAVLLVAFVGYTIWRRRRAPVSGEAAQPDAEPVESPAVSAVSAERQALVDAIARLDDRFAAGELDAAAYDRQRSEQKSRLLALSAPAATGR